VFDALDTQLIGLSDVAVKDHHATITLAQAVFVLVR
jgi:hypothetical protein